VLIRLAPIAIALFACTRSSEPIDSQTPDAPVTAIDARPDSGVDKSGPCVDTFGTSLTDGVGRLDATVIAVVPPGSDCPRPNSTHLILEVRQGGGRHRMVAVRSGVAIATWPSPSATPPRRPAWEGCTSA
jgi:hypothetical protein